VIGVGVADQDAADAPRPGRHDRRDVARVIGARIDDRDAAVAIID
jgi:hypothetical protein